MVTNNESYKINTTLLELLNIENKIYNNLTLQNALIASRKNKNENYNLSSELKLFLNEDDDCMNIHILIKLIKVSYSDSIKYPNYDFYHYNQKPIYT